MSTPRIAELDVLVRDSQKHDGRVHTLNPLKVGAVVKDIVDAGLDLVALAECQVCGIPSSQPYSVIDALKYGGIKNNRDYFGERMKIKIDGYLCGELIMSSEGKSLIIGILPDAPQSCKEDLSTIIDKYKLDS